MTLLTVIDGEVYQDHSGFLFYIFNILVPFLLNWLPVVLLIFISVIIFKIYMLEKRKFNEKQNT